MKWAVSAGVTAAAGAAVMLIVAAVMFAGAGAVPPASASAPVCTATSATKVTGSSTVPGTVMHIGPAQATNIKITLSVAAGMHMGAHGALIGLITEEQESRFENLANPGRYPETMSMPHDGIGQDHGSVGIFQQQPQDGWGTPAQDMTPKYAAGRFFQALEGVHGWQVMLPWLAAQAVQQSGDSSGMSYEQWMGDAKKILAHFHGAAAPPPSMCAATTGPGGSKPPTKQAATAIAFARKQLGKPYVWGATGPDTFDCSGLTLRAWQAAGVNLPRVSRDQWNAGRHVPIKQAQPGDLVFWADTPADPTTIHHVALYLGTIKGVPSILQAPQPGEFVDIHPLHWPGGDDQLMPTAVRVTR